MTGHATILQLAVPHGYRGQPGSVQMDPPAPSIQYKATVLSSQQCCSVILSSPMALATFVIRFTAICPTINSSLGIVNPLFANRDLAATRVWLSPELCLLTLYTVAETPLLLASPNAWRYISSISSRCGAIGRGTVTTDGMDHSHDNHFFRNFPSSSASHAILASQISQKIIFPCRVIGDAQSQWIIHLCKSTQGLSLCWWFCLFNW